MSPPYTVHIQRTGSRDSLHLPGLPSTDPTTPHSRPGRLPRCRKSYDVSTALWGLLWRIAGNLLAPRQTGVFWVRPLPVLPGSCRGVQAPR